MAKTEKSGSLSLLMSLASSARSRPPAAAACPGGGLLELAALDHVVGEPGLLVGADEGHAADLLGDLLGDRLEGRAVGQRHAPGAEDLLEQGRLGGQEERVLGDRHADRALERLDVAAAAAGWGGWGRRSRRSSSPGTRASWGTAPASSISLLRVFWNALASSRATPRSIRWLSSLIGFLKSLIMVIRSPSGPKMSFWKFERLAAVGADELLLEDVEHAGLELVDQVVDGVVGVVEVPAQRLVAGDGRGDPGLGPEVDRRAREDLEQALTGAGARKKVLVRLS